MLYITIMYTAAEDSAAEKSIGKKINVQSNCTNKRERESNEKVNILLQFYRRYIPQASTPSSLP
jgi:hypothetical protein